MQVYADLRILTARPSIEEEARAPHRLFGHIDGAEACSAARWAAEARAAIAEAQAEDRLPILVGGTGLYLRTLIDGIAPIPEIDPTIRAEVRALPVAEAHAALALADPAAAARLHATDTSRVARALEVVRATGRTLAEWQDRREGGIRDAVQLAAMILLPDRAWLGERIDHRFATMLATAEDEVRALLARTDVPADAPVLRAIGVAEIGRVLRGEWTAEQAQEAGATATRQYAKRQYTWFRRQPPGGWEVTTETDTYENLINIERKLFQ